MQEKSADTSQNKSFVSVLWDLPAALCRNKLFLRNLLITGLRLEKQATQMAGKARIEVTYSAQSCAYILNLCFFSKTCLCSQPLVVHHSWRVVQCFYVYICVYPLALFTLHYTKPSLMTDISRNDRLIIFNIFISFFGTHYSSTQPLQNFNILPMIWVGLIPSLKRGSEAWRDLCQKVLSFWVPSLR